MELTTILIIAGVALLAGGAWKLMSGHDKNFESIPTAAGQAMTQNFSSDMGWLAALVGEKRVAQQNALLEQITQQINQIALMGQAQANALTAQYNLLNLPSQLTMQGQESLAAFNARISQQQNIEAVNKAATAMGVSPLTWEQIAMLKAKQQVDFSSKLEDLAFTVIQKKELDSIDVEITDKLNKLKLFMVQEKYFMPQTILKKLNDELSGLYQQSQNLADMTMPPAQKRKEATRIRQYIKHMEEQVREQAERIRGGVV